MAFAPADTTFGVLGEFQEVEFGKFFQYAANPYKGTDAFCKDFEHIVFTIDGFRYANVLKTVAHICNDEDAEGNPLTEKWNIKKHYKSAK